MQKRVIGPVTNPVTTLPLIVFRNRYLLISAITHNLRYYFHWFYVNVLVSQGSMRLRNFKRKIITAGEVPEMLLSHVQNNVLINTNLRY